MFSEENKIDEAKVEEKITLEEAKDDEKIKETSPKKEKNKYKEKIAELEAELAKNKEDYLRVLADMQNTKKRLSEEQTKDRKYASQKVIGELINPIDMLIKIVNAPAPNPEIGNYLIGFQMIANQLISVLEAEGLSEIKAADQVFDPMKMHAMATIETNDIPKDQVVEVLQAGYMYKDRVLRPAMVKVSVPLNEKTEEQSDNEGEDNNE